LGRRFRNVGNREGNKKFWLNTPKKLFHLKLYTLCWKSKIDLTNVQKDSSVPSTMYFQLYLVFWCKFQRVFLPSTFLKNIFFLNNFRSILTDPEIHQKLHDSHYEQQSRYYGYWYGTDLYAYDSQVRQTDNLKFIESKS
jgi:hypothetical protein